MASNKLTNVFLAALAALFVSTGASAFSFGGKDAAPQTPTAAPKPANVKSVTIGCVLPLSGDQAEAAAQALKGIQLAFSAKSQFVDGAGLKLVLKDSGGSAESMAQAMKELAADDSVLAVVGMLNPDNALFALLGAGENLAVIAPSAGIKSQNGRRHLLQMEVTDYAQTRLLAETAIKSLGLRNFAVLHPDDQYGADMARLFSEAVRANGGTVTVQEKYDPAQTDFRAQMTALGGMDDQHLRHTIYSYAKEHPDKSIEELNKSLSQMYSKGRSYPQITKSKSVPLTKNNFSFEMRVGYDAIFLPAGYEQAGLILPALAFYNVTNVLVLGTDRMLSPELVTIGGKYAEDVLFTGEFYPTMPGDEARNFVENYRNAVGETPDVIAARFYDAMMLTLSTAETGGAKDRKKMLELLSNISTYSGVSGTVAKGPDGSLEKIPYIFTVERGKIIGYTPPVAAEKK